MGFVMGVYLLNGNIFVIKINDPYNHSMLVNIWVIYFKKIKNCSF